MTHLFCLLVGVAVGYYIHRLRRQSKTGHMIVYVKRDDGHVERQMVKVWKRMEPFRPLPPSY